MTPSPRGSNTPPAARPPGLMMSSLAAAAMLFLAVAVFLGAARQYQADVLTHESIRLYEAGTYPKSRELAARAIQIYPNNGYARWRLGANELYLEQYDQAVRTLAVARTTMPHLPQLYRLLGQCQYFLKDFAHAADTLDIFFSMEPEPRVAREVMHRMYAQSLYRSQRFGEAAVALARAEEFQAFRPELMQSRIVNAILLNQNIMADYLYRRLRTLYPGTPLDSAELFSNVLAENKLAGATRFLEFLRLRGDGDLSLRKLLALGYFKGRRLDEALTILNEIRSATPKDAEVHLFLGDVLFQKGDLPAAQAAYREHLNLDPKSRFRDEIQKKFGGAL